MLNDKHINNIPNYLKTLEQWVLWRYESRGTGKPTRVPYQTNGKYKARCNDPCTWTSFDECMRAFETGMFDGIGFVFADGDGLFGADLDHCFSENRSLDPWADAIVEQFNSTYIEISPSGEGLHIIGLGSQVVSGKSKKWPKIGTAVDQGIELYDHKSPRYFTVTGDAFNDEGISQCQPALDWIYQKFFAPVYPTPPQARTIDGGFDRNLVLQALEFIPADDYKTWLDIGMALKSGGFELELWEEWSRKSVKFEEGLCNAKWQSFRR